MVNVGCPIVPCSVGHGFEVTVRPMAKTKGDRVGDALCFHLASVLGALLARLEPLTASE